MLENVLVAPENPAAVLEAMADPGVRIVSLTVTEKGYCHHPATGVLTVDHPDIAHDLQQEMPRSAPGFLVRALAHRRAAGVPPFTVLSCDNLPENSALVRQIVLYFAHLMIHLWRSALVKKAGFPLQWSTASPRPPHPPILPA
ncbi:hypothetical protein N9O21_01515 [Rhodobacteraceae bacterium]|nr:hypothetical protein [Paracoccaceae bacterium]